MKRFRLFLLAAVLLSVIVILYVWFFIWNKPQVNVSDADAVKVEAAALFTAYSSDEQLANTNYLEKILEVTGKVTSVTQNAEGFTVVLLQTNDPMFGINCTLEQKNVTVREGDTVTLKGICIGYLTDVVLIRCYKIN
ncbi:MAG TPA: hypothetical protein VFV46_04205 [Lacibacter sp.]|nr:hypothetical protein [Lacibacter sp.]